MSGTPGVSETLEAAVPSGLVATGREGLGSSLPMHESGYAGTATALVSATAAAVSGRTDLGKDLTVDVTSRSGVAVTGDQNGSNVVTAVTSTGNMRYIEKLDSGIARHHHRTLTDPLTH